jgi:hypothetical protein
MAISRGFIVVLICASFAWCLLACFSPPPSESILFTTIGHHTFQDFVYTIHPDGSGIKTFLSPKPDRSYTYASGNSLRGTFVVTVHEANAKGTVEDHIYTYRVGSDDWRRLFPGDTIEGGGVLSPDNSQVAFILSPKTQLDKDSVWVLDIKTGSARELVPHEDETWVNFLRWRPDSQELIFIRFRQSDDGIDSELMQIAASGGVASVLLSEDAGVADACYAPDGKRLAMWAAGGLEILDISSLKRITILPWDKLPSNHMLQAGGLDWSPAQDKIVFSLFDKQSGNYELWTISSDGSGAKKLYTSVEGRIQGASFIKTK